MSKMDKIQRTWNYNGRVIHEDQVRICEADVYIRGELLEPMRELYGMMDRHDGILYSPMGVAGRIGVAMADVSTERMCNVFHVLNMKSVAIEVILATEKTPGLRTGTIIDVEIRKIEEGLS